jgi:hypothetical protein
MPTLPFLLLSLLLSTFALGCEPEEGETTSTSGCIGCHLQ